MHKSKGTRMISVIIAVTGINSFPVKIPSARADIKNIREVAIEMLMLFRMPNTTGSVLIPNALSLSISRISKGMVTASTSRKYPVKARSTVVLS
jgi:hypothetical protein